MNQAPPPDEHRGPSRNAAASVYMFVLNSFTHDTRVLKEAKALVAAGYDVRVLAIKDGQTRASETIDSVQVLRIPRSWYLSLPLAVYRRCVQPMVARIVGARGRQRAFAPGALAASSGADSPPRRRQLICGRITGLVSRLLHADYGRKCLRIVRRQPADVYHAHDLKTLPVACRAAKQLGGKVVYDSHELFVESPNVTPATKSYWQRVEEDLIHRADEIVVVCDSIGDELVRRYEVKHPTVVRNCCEPLDAPVSRNRLRDALHVADAPIALYQGAFTPGRGLENLVLAARHLRDAVVVLLGWGVLEEPLRRQIRELGLERRVFILPRVPLEELLQWTASADLGVVPIQALCRSYFYACPNKLFEAIAAGIPIAASDFPEMKRIVETYGIGRTFDAEQPQVIAEVINSMVGDPEALETWRQNSVAARKTLNWKTESQRLLAAYDRLLDR